MELIGKSQSQLDPDFQLTATMPSGNSPTYHLTATSAPLPAGASFWWAVEELDLVTGNVLPNTTMENPSAWWGNPTTNVFQGYYNNSSPVGVFKQGHKYRIRRGVWSLCHQWKDISKVVFMCNNCKSVDCPACTGSVTAPGGVGPVAGMAPLGATPTTSPSPSPQPSPQVKLERDYRFKSVSSPGLNTHILMFPNGSQLKINLPNDLAVGDTFSGTVQTEATGKDEKARARNQAEIDKSVLLIGGQPIRAAERIFTRTIPPQLSASEPFVVLKVKGKEVVNVRLPISPTPAHPTASTQLPTCGQMGRNIVIMNHGDGIITPTDFTSVGETQLQTLAESASMRVVENVSQTAGLTEIKYSEQGSQVRGPFMNLGVALTSPNTNLQTGQTTEMELIVSAPGVQQTILLDLINNTPGLVTISGGDRQQFTIHLADVQADGTYRKKFTVTAISAGAWGAAAIASCVRQVAAAKAVKRFP
ncbi:MAG TPA: hypothetical protein VN282_24230 [Pyrinomonadaceae bacterium]|nr:hypothetical protein [Pyrinomonadaceae bacterium]